MESLTKKKSSAFNTAVYAVFRCFLLKPHLMLAGLRRKKVASLIFSGEIHIIQGFDISWARRHGTIPLNTLLTVSTKCNKIEFLTKCYYCVGTCSCSSNRWSGMACDDCAKNSYGSKCDRRCNCVNGTCSDGITGTGACSCQPGYRIKLNFPFKLNLIF